MKFSSSLLVRLSILAVFFATAITCTILPIQSLSAAENQEAPDADWLTWNQLPDLPEELGVSGSFVGVHNNALIIAGGTNFPQPTWETNKQWHDDIYVLTKEGSACEWHAVGNLENPIAYGAAVSTPVGVVCVGGNDSTSTFDEVFLLTWDRNTKTCKRVDFPRLPSPCAYGQATFADGVIYLAGGQSGLTLDSAMKNFWTLDLSKQGNPEDFQWKKLKAWPGPARAFNLTMTQHDGYHNSVYVMSGRFEEDGEVKFLTDAWQFTPDSGTWRKRAELPRPMVAGVAAPWGQSHMFVLGGDDGELFGRADELKDDHPGFPREALAYHTITDSWSSAGSMPQNKVTTIPVLWDNQIVLACGEIRPRIRTPQVWTVRPKSRSRDFGIVNYSVLILYLLAMVSIGIYFANRNKNTNDYFRGGKKIPW